MTPMTGPAVAVPLLLWTTIAQDLPEESLFDSGAQDEGLKLIRNAGLKSLNKKPKRKKDKSS